jgi:hypothetical protein
LNSLFSCGSNDKCVSINKLSNILSQYPAANANSNFPQNDSNPYYRQQLLNYTPGANATPGANDISNMQRFANGLNNAIGTAGSILSTTTDAAGNIITKSLDAAGNVVTTTTDTAGNILSRTVAAAGNLATGTANALSNTAKNIGGDVGSTLTSGVAGLSSLGQDAIAGTAGLLKGAGSDLKNALASGSRQPGSIQGQGSIQGAIGQTANQQQNAIVPVNACNANTGVDFYSYYGALPTKTASNYMPVTADFSAFAK